LLEVLRLREFCLQLLDSGFLLAEAGLEFGDAVLARAGLLADGLQFRDQVVADAFEVGPLDVLQSGRRAGVEGPLAVELHATHRVRPVCHQKSLAVVEVLDRRGVLAVENPADDLRVVVPGEPMPEQPVTLRNKILFDICGTLADATDAQSVFPAALANLDEHLPTLADRPLFGDVLVDLLDQQQERLFLFLCLCEEAAGDVCQECLGLGLVEIARHVEDDGDVLFERERGEFFGVFDRDLDVTLLVCARVENLVLLFQAVVLAINIDDKEAKAAVEQVLCDDTRGV